VAQSLNVLKTANGGRRRVPRGAPWWVGRVKTVRRRWIWIGAVLLALAVLVAALDTAIDEPMRRRVEADMNQRLKGYTVSIRALDYHLWHFSLDLKDAVFVQDANPEPPVLHIPKLSASVHWRALLHGRLVADFALYRPKLYANRKHILTEARVDVPIKDRGWQEALEAIYPLKINEFRIADGDVVYVDDGPFKPLHIGRVNIKADNIRNVRSKRGTYPSPVRLEGVVFETGKLVVEGDADFLAEPHLAVKGAVSLDGMDLSYFEAIVRRYNLTVRAGTLSLAGQAEFAPSVKVVDLEHLTLKGVQADYAHKAATAAAERAVKRQAVETAKQASNNPEVVLRAKEVRLIDGNVGYVDRAAKPEYRVFVSNANVTLTDFSNQAGEGTSVVRLRGKFMGSGDTQATGTFRARTRSPDFDIKLAIENTDMTTMNDLLRAHGKFDVAAGNFSFFSELAIRNGRVDGYLKPLFKDMQVYDPSQDREKSFGQKLRERAADLAAKVLKNRPREEVATRAEVAGPLENPQRSTWEIIVNLLRNAFVKAILPGFDREARRPSR
jgi:hypothetical protein